MTTLQVQLDSISRPSCNAAAKKIAILRPHRDLQHEGDSDNRPVFDVARDHSLPRELLEIPIEGFIHGLDKQPNLIEHRRAGFRVIATAAEYLRNVPASIVEAHILRVEADRVLVSPQQRVHTFAQRCADQYVGV
jgi:hypothetical protein